MLCPEHIFCYQFVPRDQKQSFSSILQAFHPWAVLFPEPDVLTKCSGPTLKNSNSIFLSHLEFILVEVFLNIFMILNGFRAVDSSCEKLGSLPIIRKRLVRPYELVRYSTKSRTVTDGSLATLGRMLPNHETKIIHSQFCLGRIKSLSKTFVGTYLRSTQM